MSVETAPVFSSAFQMAQGYASHAARQLARGEHDYQEDKVTVIDPRRREMSVGDPVTGVNVVMSPMRTTEALGWHLKTKQSDEDEEPKWFFLSRTKKIMIIWEGMSLYATPLTMKTFVTALIFITDEEMAGIAHELKTIARK